MEESKMEDKIVVKNVSKMFGKEKVLDNVTGR